MKHQVLLNPGPVNVTRAVRKALAGPDICHRESEFRDLIHRIQGKLLSIFGLTKTHRVALFTGSGTSALESMIVSFANNRGKMLVLSNGVYGERMQSILKFHGLPYSVLSSPLGQFPSLTDIERALTNPDIYAVAMVHHETSSGMLNPLADVARLSKKHGKYLLADVISSMGAESIDFSNLDLCAGVSGKCLHGFPGISFVLVSNRAAIELKKRPKRTLYLDLASSLEHAGQNDTAFTPAVQILYALETALDELKEESLHKRIKSYEKKQQVLAEGMDQLGLRRLIESGRQSHVLTAFWVPEGLTYNTLHDALKKKGFVIYSGQSSLKDRIFRVSNLGEVSVKDLRCFLSILSGILKRKKR